MAQSVRLRVAGLQPVQVLAGLAALAFLALGIAGFVYTGFGDFTGHDHALLLGFAINPLHNLMHVVVGLVGLLLATTSASARLFGWILFAGYGLVLAWGLMIVGLTASNPLSELGNPLNLNIADNWLHLAFAVLGLVIAVLPARRKVILPEEPVEQAPEPVTEPVPAQAQTVTTDTVTTDTAADTEPEPEPKRGGLHRLTHRRSTPSTP
jgi:hypothetical protein